MDELGTFLQEVARKKKATLRFSEGRIDILSHGEVIGSVTYSIGDQEIVHKSLKTRDVTSMESCISIHSLHVESGQQGKKLGSLLIACALRAGIQHGCTYSVLDDMSDYANHIQKNIYGSFGYTHKDVTQQKGDAFYNTGPEKQLKLPSSDEMLKLFRKRLIGGTRRIKKSKTRRRYVLRCL